ncbi:tRNA(Met) cytidine acetyltransferase TmcA [Vibrio mimicus]|uniref:tRNA(Met) cytidine acetyltransferase TmcA n=1 Tax=Vibrio mimicus TaxID=674 RepID=UPI00076B4400|nr:GNAT family N-acetyltransferase [Vibrio mimicus]AMG01700.1 GNAT family N-acetyltransferase [Vibrio mimicus]KAA3492829.1 tRNA(Met) cytidine acetyltransferase [Vibrio mimicus]
MTQPLTYLLQLQQLAQQQNTRFGCWLRGDTPWLHSTLKPLISHFADQSVFMLGDTELDGVTCVDYRQGQQWLGKECQLLICDLTQGWDANSFNAALGTLAGGGMLIVTGEASSLQQEARIWLEKALGELLVISPQGIPPLPQSVIALPEMSYAQQELAIESIIKVVTGHRKRPLVLTADRGRGKTSALGIAAAELMQSRSVRILVTAPALASVDPLFIHAQRKLTQSNVKRGHMQWENSTLSFIAPDELLRTQPECDLLLVDEAAALPLPLLKRLVEKYHRIVFSSTIHGYEGCGRGFSLKFQQWLHTQRPQMRALHLDQPIRWAAGDALEQWQNRVFLLQSELPELTVECAEPLKFVCLTKTDSVQQPESLAEVFALLVNAHYQTSPNDLFSLLNDEAMTLFVAYRAERCVGCLLAVKEGELDETLIEAIQLGTRRPKGHLAPVTLANQLGIAEAAHQSCYRVLRIAVHPDCQREGIGSQLLNQFTEQHHADYYATSFGVSEDLLPFWLTNHFVPVKFGSHRDQASGCYSILMVRRDELTWLEQAQQQFSAHWIFELSDSLQALEPEIVQQLLPYCVQPHSQFQFPALIERYAQGGANYESVAVWLFAWLVDVVTSTPHIPSPLLIGKVLQRKSWAQCAEQFQLNGKRQVEQTLRADMLTLLSNLHCK